MRKIFSCLLLLSCLWILVPAGFADDASFKSALVIDAQKPDDAGKWGRFERYEFSETSVAPYTGSRKVLFGTPLEFDFEGLPDGKDCKITASFLSDSDREIVIDVNGTEIESGLDVPQGKQVEQSWVVPASRLYSGRLSVTISPLAGPNATLLRLEILTSDGKALSPGKRKAFQEATDEELEKLVMPLPRITPRPTTVNGADNPMISLNGIWEFSPTGKEAFKPIKVPGEWKMQGFDVPAKSVAIYKKKMAIPADWSGREARIRFDSVHAVCEVFVNGKPAGKHEGGFIPFELDVKEAIRPGEENEFEVRVQSESTADSVSCISQYAAHQVGGILRKVTLISLPEVSFSAESNWTTFDKSYKNPVLHYETEVTNASDTARETVVQVSLKDAKGTIVANDSRKVTVTAMGTQKVKFDFPVKNARLWTSETPYLYTLTSHLKSAAGSLMTHDLKIGLRQIEVSGNQLLVNGMPVKLLGVCRHEVHPLSGRSLTPDLCRKDAELYRAANANLIRTSHYPPTEEFLDACDELGLFVECEAAVCWIEHHASPVWRRWNYLNSDYFPYFLRPNLDQISAYGNHPSIIMWSLCNESKWSSLWAKVLQVVKRYEQHRPILFHDQSMGGFNNAGSKGDIANYHYPSENNPESWNDLGRPLWFGEYAHLQCYNRRELATDSWIQEDWGRPLQRMVDLMWEQKGCLGGTIWSGIDDVFHLPDGNLCGYGHWGPIDGWRREKPEYHGMKMSYSPFRVFDVAAIQGRSVKLTVQNRQNFLNFNQNRITWSTGKKQGTVKMDLAPHQKGELVINGSFNEGDVVTISVTDPRGCEIGREAITIKSKPSDKVKSMKSRERLSALKLSSQEGKFTAANGLAFPLPVPMVLALNGSGGAAGPAGSTLSNEIDPFTPVRPWTWKLDEDKDGTTIFQGEGEAGTGTLEIIPQKNGSIHVKYSITVAESINPRQWGLVFEFPKAFDTLSWNRNSHWSWYPEDQIGRPTGTARANPVARKFVEEPGVAPKTPWFHDSNTLGTKDFRSTKGNIKKASLFNTEGKTFSILPVDDEITQSVRPWIEGETTKILVAGFNTGGADGFFGTHYSKERRPIGEKETVTSEFIIQVEDKK